MTSPSPSPDTPLADGEPSPRRITTVLGVVFAAQILSMLAIVAGAVVLMATFAHNSDCSGNDFVFTTHGSCQDKSYALPIALLAGGFGAFLVCMVVSATYAMRHVGAPLLSAVALSLRRRRSE